MVSARLCSTADAASVAAAQTSSKMDAAQHGYPVAVLVHIPIPFHLLEHTKHQWFPFLGMVCQHTGESEEQVLSQINNGTIRLHLAYDPDENQAHALVGVTIFLRGEERVARVVWTAGLNRKQWFELLPEFERFHKEYENCAAVSAIVRRGWIPDLKENGYRWTRALVEKRL